MTGEFMIVNNLRVKQASFAARDIDWLNLEKCRRSVATTDPLIIVYELPKVACTGMLVFAPIDHALASPFSSVDRRWARSLVGDPKFYRNFRDSLEQLGLEGGTTIHALFGPYANFGAYLGGREAAFRVIDCVLSSNFRIGGMVVPNACFPSALMAATRTLSRNPCAFVFAREGQEVHPAAPHAFNGIGRLYGIPASKLAEAERRDLLLQIQQFQKNWQEGGKIPGSYLDFFRGVLGSSYSGPLAPADDLDERICLARLDSLFQFGWTPFRFSINAIMDRPVAGSDINTVRLYNKFAEVRDRLRAIADDD